jgi:hypothetical protein
MLMNSAHNTGIIRFVGLEVMNALQVLPASNGTLVPRVSGKAKFQLSLSP